MMDLHETVTVAIDALRSNKLRASLTMLGVIIGSASIVLMVTVSLTGRKFVINLIEGIGSNLLWVDLVNAGASGQPLSYELNLDDMKAIKNEVPQVSEVAGIRELSMEVVVAGKVRPVNLIGVTDEYQAIRRLLILRGRYFDSDDMESRSKVCLITKELSDRVFRAENPIGRTIRIGELTFTVIGVFRERVSTFEQSEIHPESVIIPFSLMTYYTGVDFVRTLYMRARTSDDVPVVQRQIRLLLKSRHPAKAEYEVLTLAEILNVANDIAMALMIILLITAFIALLISGIGIMNIMLVTVKERTREIGIRKAIGAAYREILYQFLMEAFLISGGGAVLGILVGLSIIAAARLLLPSDLRIPINGLSIIVAFVVSCSTGLFFGYLPAGQAARLEPIDALRYE